MAKRRFKVNIYDKKLKNGCMLTGMDEVSEDHLLLWNGMEQVTQNLSHLLVKVFVLIGGYSKTYTKFMEDMTYDMASSQRVGLMKT